ncbi:DegV family protein [Aggregatilinea lenta]|uniref:DegV family protein n=1 Tax=Aggregatilinea lenta TaxID=913108 RepID=UPI0013C2F448|nr:DegV family protein [Aggregatilinea lenta]
MVTVVTDSCASVPQTLIEQLNIEVVPYYLHTTLGTLRDGVDMPPDAFYAWLPTAPAWPTTANPAPGDYLEALRRVAARGDSVVMVCMTGTGSGGFQSATLARQIATEDLPRLDVRVIDTQQVALAHGWAVIQAARAALDGGTVEQVAAVARDVAARAFVGFTNDTLAYLQRGGRIGKVAGMVGEALSLKPVIGMRGGMPASLAVARSRSGAYRRIVTLAAGRIPGGSVRAALMHVAAQDEVEKFRVLLEERYSVVEWIVAQLSPALGCHSGPGTVGISIIPA